MPDAETPLADLDLPRSFPRSYLNDSTKRKLLSQVPAFWQLLPVQKEPGSDCEYFAALDCWLSNDGRGLFETLVAALADCLNPLAFTAGAKIGAGGDCMLGFIVHGSVTTEIAGVAIKTQHFGLQKRAEDVTSADQHLVFGTTFLYDCFGSPLLPTSQRLVSEGCVGLVLKRQDVYDVVEKVLGPGVLPIRYSPQKMEQVVSSVRATREGFQQLLFDGAPTWLANCCSKFESRLLSPGELWIRQGEAVPFFAFVNDGELLVDDRAASGETRRSQRDLRRIGRGIAFGESSLWTDDTATRPVRWSSGAAEESSLYPFSKASLVAATVCDVRVLYAFRFQNEFPGPASRNKAPGRGQGSGHELLPSLLARHLSLPTRVSCYERLTRAVVFRGQTIASDGGLCLVTRGAVDEQVVLPSAQPCRVCAASVRSKCRCGVPVTVRTLRRDFGGTRTCAVHQQTKLQSVKVLAPCASCGEQVSKGSVFACHAKCKGATCDFRLCLPCTRRAPALAEHHLLVGGGPSGVVASPTAEVWSLSLEALTSAVSQDEMDALHRACGLHMNSTEARWEKPAESLCSSCKEGRAQSALVSNPWASGSLCKQCLCSLEIFGATPPEILSRVWLFQPCSEEFRAALLATACRVVWHSEAPVLPNEVGFLMVMSGVVKSGGREFRAGQCLGAGTVAGFPVSRPIWAVAPGSGFVIYRSVFSCLMEAFPRDASLIVPAALLSKKNRELAEKQAQQVLQTTLSAVPFFSSCSKAFFHHLLQQPMVHGIYSPQEVVFEQGVAAEWVGFLVVGTVRMFSDGIFRGHTKAAPDVLGVLSMFGMTPSRTATVVCSDVCHIVMVSAVCWGELVSQFPDDAAILRAEALRSLQHFVKINLIASTLAVGMHRSFANYVGEHAEVVVYERGVDICKQGSSDPDPWMGIILLAAHPVDVLIDNVMMGSKSEGQYFGEMLALKFDDARSATLRTKGVTAVGRINSQVIQQALKICPEAAEVFRNMAKGHLVKNLSGLTTLEAAEFAHSPGQPFFQGCSGEFLSRLRSILRTEVFYEGQQVIREGVPGDRLVILARGCVTVRKKRRPTCQRGHTVGPISCHVCQSHIAKVACTKCSTTLCPQHAGEGLQVKGLRECRGGHAFQACSMQCSECSEVAEYRCIRGCLFTSCSAHFRKRSFLRLRQIKVSGNDAPVVLDLPETFTVIVPDFQRGYDSHFATVLAETTVAVREAPLAAVRELLGCRQMHKPDHQHDSWVAEKALLMKNFQLEQRFRSAVDLKIRKHRVHEIAQWAQSKIRRVGKLRVHSQGPVTRRGTSKSVVNDVSTHLDDNSRWLSETPSTPAALSSAMGEPEEADDPARHVGAALFSLVPSTAPQSRRKRPVSTRPGPEQSPGASPLQFGQSVRGKLALLRSSYTGIVAQSSRLEPLWGPGWALQLADFQNF